MSQYRGRFAPSPTGPLHFGSLVAAVASYLDARHNNGQWFVRIDDIDHFRVRKDSARDICNTLELFGMEWDGEILYQSKRIPRYLSFLDTLTARGLAYRCSCSRKEIASVAVEGIEGPVYPGTCRQGANPDATQYAYRVITDNNPVSFHDVIQVDVSQRLESEIGDFILKRADGVIAYQLAIVADDEEQAINRIVRGSDLLLSTPRQIYLQRLLGFHTPEYAHIPLVIGENGKKLSKSDAAWPVDTQHPVRTLNRVLQFLGQDQIEADTIGAFWKEAITRWNIGRVPKRNA